MSTEPEPTIAAVDAAEVERKRKRKIKTDAKRARKARAGRVKRRLANIALLAHGVKEVDACRARRSERRRIAFRQAHVERKNAASLASMRGIPVGDLLGTHPARGYLLIHRSPNRHTMRMKGVQLRSLVASVVRRENWGEPRTCRRALCAEVITAIHRGDAGTEEQRATLDAFVASLKKREISRLEAILA